MIHTLKVEAPYFDALADGSKPFEVRRNDRAFQRGDVLILREWGYKDCGRSNCTRKHGPVDFTGREVHRAVTYVYAGDPRWPDSIGAGFVVLGLDRCCEHAPELHDQHGCTVDVSEDQRAYVRCHGLDGEVS